MWPAEINREWEQLAQEVFTGLREWRVAHPQATLSAIEAALDTRLATVRARVLQDVALSSAATNVSSAPATMRPVCPECGHALDARGQEARTLTTQGDQSITFTRSRAVCPACGTGLFPPG